MTKYIDADTLKSAKFHPLPYTHIVPDDVNAESYKRGWNDALDAAAEELPAADVVEVIRCKDCCWYEIAQLKADGTEDKRYKPSYCDLTDRYRHKNYFCASARRRET